MPKQQPILSELFFSFMKVGLFTFGGGYAMISVITDTCVEKKQWLTQDEMMDLTVVAESTPGPIAINCATYVGYKISLCIKAAISESKGFISCFGRWTMVTSIPNSRRFSASSNPMKPPPASTADLGLFLLM